MQIARTSIVAVAVSFVTVLLFPPTANARVHAGQMTNAPRDPPRPRKPPQPLPPRLVDWKSYILMGPHDLVNGTRGQHELDAIQWHWEGRSVCFSYDPIWCDYEPGIVREEGFHKSYELSPETAAMIPGLPVGDGWTPWVHNLKDQNGDVAEFAAWHPDRGIVLFWEVSGVTQEQDLTGRPRTWMHYDEDSWQPGIWWAPKTQGFFLHQIRENHSVCANNTPQLTEWGPIGYGVSEFFLPLNISTPTLKKKAAETLRRYGIVPPNSSDDEAIPQEWVDELRRVGGDGPVHLIVKIDWLDTISPGTRKPDLVEHYFYVGLNVDSDRPFGGGLVRWSVRSNGTFFAEGTATRLVEEFGSDRIFAKPLCK